MGHPKDKKKNVSWKNLGSLNCIFISLIEAEKIASFSGPPTILLLVNRWKIKQVALNAECKFWNIPRVEDYKSILHFVN